MKQTKKFLAQAFLLLGLILPCGLHAATDIPTNATQAVLTTPSFREGLVWVGSTEPTEVESQRLLGILQVLDQPVWPAEVERFLADNPASPWAPSLHHAYASFCRRTGRTTKALQHWEAAWLVLKDAQDKKSRELGGAVLAGWTDLLASLGRLEKLQELVIAGDKWHFVNRQHREKFMGAKNSLSVMRTHPELSFRCGTLALKAVGQSFAVTNRALEQLIDMPSPTNGFSLAKLSELSKSLNLGLVAARRTNGQDLIVPSVVHWRQNHYAAILEARDGFYLLNDPTFGEPKWVVPDAINEEASGVFLIPATSLNSNWELVALNEAEKVHGMGLQNGIHDGKDKGCTKYFCPKCTGMPIWWVSEPYENLWMADEPLSYLTSRGEPFTFKMTYKQRDTRPNSTVGTYADLPIVTGWNHTWSSYVRITSDVPCDQIGAGGCTMPNFMISSATLYLPNGGEVGFPNHTATRYDQESQLLLQQAEDTFGVGPDFGDNGFRVVHDDGSQDIYGQGASYHNNYGDYTRADFLLTRHIDPYGNTTFINYERFSAFYRVKSVVDYDGRTNTFTYDSNSRLKQVTSPYGQSTQMDYDDNWNLISITDAAGLVSELTYDTNNYPVTLATPYGTNQFEFTENATLGGYGGHDTINRAVRATDPSGATRLYLYRYDCSLLMPTNYASIDIPTNTPLGTLDAGTGGTNLLSGSCYRNSFYWDPRQYETLSTTNIYSLTSNDYIRGRMYHWLQDTNELYLSGQVSVERDPSPDGTTEGIKYFYDYQGKIFNHRAGTSPLPSVKAWCLPGGETHYDYKQYNYFGNVTNLTTTYTKSDGSLGTRSTRFVYADNTYTNVWGAFDNFGNLAGAQTNTFTIPNLLTKVIGPDGSNLWSFAGYDVITWTNDFYRGSGQTNRDLTIHQRVLPHYLTNGVNDLTIYSFTNFDKIASIKWPAGLTTTNIYATNGFLAKTIDLEVSRTNSFSYTTNGLVLSYTNELGLVTQNSWDNLLRLTGVGFPDNTTISNIYTALDLGDHKDRMGNWTRYGFNAIRQLTSITNALDHVTMLSYCGCGSLESITDPLNKAVTFTRDYQGRVTAITFADGSYVNLNNNLLGQTTNITDSAHHSFTNTYNNQGLLVTSRNALGLMLQNAYDLYDRATNVVNAEGLGVTNLFDVMGRLRTRSYPDTGVEKFFYSNKGLIAYTNTLGYRTLYDYDPAGRLTTITNANGETNVITYDPADNMLTLVDGKNQKTSWGYNLYGLMISKTNANNLQIITNAYDANGRLTTNWTAAKGITAYDYDSVDNLKTITYPHSTVSFAYDGDERLTNMVDLTGTTKFSYTNFGAFYGALASEDGPWASDTISYNYTNRMRASLSLLQPAGSWTQTYGYDIGSRLQSIISPAGSFGYQYYGAGALLQKLTLPGSSYITNYYDNVGQLKETSLKDALANLLNYHAYSYDTMGQRGTAARTDLGHAEYLYDAIGQLTNALAYEPDNLTVRLNEKLGYGYDKAGNLNSRVMNALTESLNADNLNQLSTVSRAGTLTAVGNLTVPATNLTVNGQVATVYKDRTYATMTGLTLANGLNSFTNVGTDKLGRTSTLITTANLPASVSFYYDLNGNLTNDSNQVFEYDDANELTSITVSNGWRSEFAYDGLLRRRKRIEYTWQGGNWVPTNEVHYVYDGRLVLQERNSNNVPQVTYTRGTDLSGEIEGSGVGGLLARTENNGSAYYHADGNGNITTLINNRGTVVARYLYDPFGNLLSKSGPLADGNIYRFSSQELHGNSGSYYYGYRYYAPNLQRWLNRDPIEEEGGINLYKFANNNSVNFIDLFGLKLTSQEVANIVYNETQSLSGKEVQTARMNVAQAIMNGDELEDAGKGKRPKTAPKTAKDPDPDVMKKCQEAVDAAKAARKKGDDPTKGSIHFNLRNKNNRDPFQKHPITTQTGPIDNSYTKKGLGPHIYINTYK